MHSDRADTWLKGIIQQRMQVAKFHGKVLKRPKTHGRPLLHPQGIEREYIAFVSRLMVQIYDAGNLPHLLPSGHQDAAPAGWEQALHRMESTWQELFETQGGNTLAMVHSFGDDIEHWNEAQWLKKLKPWVGEQFYPPGSAMCKQAVGVWAKTNFELIKTMGQKEIVDLNTRMQDLVKSGASARDIRKGVEAMGEQYRGWRAERLARDQAGKLVGSLTKTRSLAAGVEMYRWRGVLDARERATHVAMEGMLRTWNSGIYPGEEIMCRCTAEPELDPIWTECETDVYGKPMTTENPESRYNPSLQAKLENDPKFKAAVQAAKESEE